MKNVLFFILFATVSLAGQEYNCYCPEVTTYQSPVQYQQPQQYIAPVTYKADPCNVVGTIIPQLISPSKPTVTPVEVILVGSFASLPKLKAGYLVKYDDMHRDSNKPRLFRVYVDHTRYNIIDAEHKAQNDGYCTIVHKTLPDNKVVGFWRT